MAPARVRASLPWSQPSCSDKRSNPTCRETPQHVHVVGRVLDELGEIGADPAEAKNSHHLIKKLGRHTYLKAVLVALGEKLNLNLQFVDTGCY